MGDTTTLRRAPLAPGSLLTNLQDSAGGTPFVAGDTLTLDGKRGGRDLPPLTYTVTGASTVGDLQNFFNQGLQIDPSVTTSNTPGATFTPDPTDPTGSFSTIDIIGNTGTDNALSLAGSGFTSSNPNMALGFATDKGTPSGESVFTSYQVYDSLGTPLTVNVTATLASKTAAGTTWQFYATSADDTDATPTFTEGQTPTSPGAIIGSGTVSFDTDGKLLGSTNPTVTINRTATGAQTPLTISLDFSKMTALTDTSSTLLMSNQDGLSIGTLTSFSVGANGQITGAFDNGLTSTLGQVAGCDVRQSTGSGRPGRQSLHRRREQRRAEDHRAAPVGCGRDSRRLIGRQQRRSLEGIHQHDRRLDGILRGQPRDHDGRSVDPGVVELQQIINPAWPLKYQ